MSSVKLSEVASQHLPVAVQYAVLLPDDDAPELQMCLLVWEVGGHARRYSICSRCLMNGGGPVLSCR